MSMFTLATSCLAISSLPLFMDLIVQVPVQYCSWQHQTLLSSPDTSRTGHCFCFGSTSSFLLELFLGSSVAYWTPTELGSSSFSVIFFFFAYNTVHGVIKARMLKWFVLPTSGIFAEYAEMRQTFGTPEVARFYQPGLGVPLLDTWVFQTSSSDTSLWPWWSQESQDHRTTVSEYSQQQGHFPATHVSLESPVLPNGSATVNNYSSSLVALLWPAR